MPGCQLAPVVLSQTLHCISPFLSFVAGFPPTGPCSQLSLGQFPLPICAMGLAVPWSYEETQLYGLWAT